MTDAKPLTLADAIRVCEYIIRADGERTRGPWKALGSRVTLPEIPEGTMTVRSSDTMANTASRSDARFTASRSDARFISLSAAALRPLAEIVLADALWTDEEWRLTGTSAERFPPSNVAKRIAPIVAYLDQFDPEWRTR